MDGRDGGREGWRKRVGWIAPEPVNADGDGGNLQKSASTVSFRFNHTVRSEGGHIFWHLEL